MSIFSSKSSRGFLDSEITPVLPDDAIGLSDDVYWSLQRAQASGKVIDFDVEPPVARDFVASSEQILAGAVAIRDGLLRDAASRIAPLQHAVDLGIETQKEVALLRLWKQFSVDVNRVDVSRPNPTWPPSPVGPV